MTSEGVVTVKGKISLLKCTLKDANTTASQFGYMALGIGDFSDNPTQLGSECSTQQEGYHRVAISVDFDELTSTATVTGIFEADNVTNATPITEVGICDDANTLEGNFFCLCKVPTMYKDSTARLKIVINVAVV